MKFSFDEYLVFILLEFYLFNHFLLYGPFNTLKFALKKVLSSNNFELTHNTTNNIKEKKKHSMTLAVVLSSHIIQVLCREVKTLNLVLDAC